MSQTQELLEKGYLAWMPEGDEAVQRAGAVAVRPGVELTRERYLMYLGVRVARMVKEASNPKRAQAYLELILQETGLLDPEISLTPQNLATAVISDNPLMMDKLESLDLTVKLPQTVTTSNPTAEQILLTVDLEGWLASLLA